jgi:hypothetical protein
MAAQITVEMMVGITPKIKDALEYACEDIGMKPSQFARQAIVEKLVREGFMTRPNFQRFNNPVPQEAAE